MTAGRLVLVVGPSGAGKDSLIAAARDHFVGDERFVFVRRVVTRDPNSFEDHICLSPDAFALEAKTGRFALQWSAHGLSYGLPIDIEEALAIGRVVVCNVSRSVVALARQRYGSGTVDVVYIDANPDIRRARIAGRGRETAAGSRMEAGRDTVDPRACTLLVDNSGLFSEAAAVFCQGIVRLADQRNETVTPARTGTATH
jgi:ribose 1,5-bisphosphokinase